MSWEIWHDPTRNMIADYATLGEALAFVWDVLADGDEETVRQWGLLDGDRIVRPLHGDDLVLAAQLAHDAPQGVITLLTRLQATEKQLQAVERTLKSLTAGGV